MIRDFKELKKVIKGSPEKHTIALIAAHDKEPLAAISRAVRERLCRAILIGNENKIKEILKELKIDPRIFMIENSTQDPESLLKGVQAVKENRADILMKGLVPTPDFMKAILAKEAELRTGRLISHLFIFENRFSRKLTILTDGGMVPYPDYQEKCQILENGVLFARKMRLEKIKISMISASEKPTDKIPSTIDFDKMKKEITYPDAVLGGPYGIDVAISRASAVHKGIESETAGDSDIWLMPNIEAGNMAAKSILYFGHTKSGGIMTGVRVPVILLSRADDAATKYNSIMLGILSAGS